MRRAAGTDHGRSRRQRAPASCAGPAALPRPLTGPCRGAGAHIRRNTEHDAGPGERPGPRRAEASARRVRPTWKNSACRRSSRSRDANSRIVASNKSPGTTCVACACTTTCGIMPPCSQECTPTRTLAAAARSRTAGHNLALLSQSFWLSLPFLTDSLKSRATAVRHELQLWRHHHRLWRGLQLWRRPSVGLRPRNIRWVQLWRRGLGRRGVRTGAGADAGQHWILLWGRPRTSASRRDRWF